MAIAMILGCAFVCVCLYQACWKLDAFMANLEKDTDKRHNK